MFKLLKIFGMKEGEHIPIPSKQKATKDIQEPVISFIKCFKENPKRFKIKEVQDVFNGDLYRRYNNWGYTLTDKLTLEVFNFTVYFDRIVGCNGDVCENHYITSIKTNNAVELHISPEEGALLWSEIQSLASRKQAKDRLTRVTKSRIEREIKYERERLTNIYK